MMTFNELVKFLEEEPDFNVLLGLPDGSIIPYNFHITEVGRVNKKFVDCGGVLRETDTCVLQVWVADDEQQHRLTGSKLLDILNKSNSIIKVDDLEVEFEYGDQRSRYPVSRYYVYRELEHLKCSLINLGTKPTECLAPDKCGVTLKCSENRCCC